MKHPFARSIFIGFVIAFVMAVAGYLTMMTFGFHETSLLGTIIFIICAWNYLLASALVSGKWLPVIAEVSLLCQFLYGFLFGWIVYTGLVYLALPVFGKRAKDLPDTNIPS